VWLLLRLLLVFVGRVQRGRILVAVVGFPCSLLQVHLRRRTAGLRVPDHSILVWSCLDRVLDLVKRCKECPMSTSTWQWDFALDCPCFLSTRSSTAADILDPAKYTADIGVMIPRIYTIINSPSSQVEARYTLTILDATSTLLIMNGSPNSVSTRPGVVNPVVSRTLKQLRNVKSGCVVPFRRTRRHTIAAYKE